MTLVADRWRRVRPADMVRVLTFACVIAVHTIAVVNPLDSVGFGGVTMLLHFTREAFFVLTGFVLMHRHRERSPSPGPFWRRRFLLVGVPYVVWTAIYTGIQLTLTPPPPDPAPRLLLINLVTGQGWYHLYFLLVSMQFYLLFPLFWRLLTATRRHHWWLIAASLALQVLVYLWLHDPSPTGVKAVMLPYFGEVFVTYQFFLVLGGVAAMHLDAVDAWIRAHVSVVVGAFLVTGAAAEGWYWWTEPDVGAMFATDVFQWVMIPWAVAVVAVFWALGAVFDDHRPASRFLGWASDRSFGVFLVHPAILFALMLGGADSVASLLPVPWSSAAAYLVAVAGSLLVVELLRRTPLSLALTGKARAHPQPVPNPPTADTSTRRATVESTRPRESRR